MFNFPKEKFIPRSGLYNQCCKDYFYDKDNQIENALAAAEGEAANIIKKVISEKSLATFNRDDRHILDFFISLQRSRTEVSLDVLNQASDKMIKEIMKHEPELKDIDLNNFKITLTDGIKQSLAFGATLYPMLNDLKVKLLINETDKCFITSDHPVTFINPFLEKKPPGGTTGYQQKGLIILLPISSNLCIALFDSKVYHLGKQSDDVRLVKACQVNEINRAMMFSAKENVYFSPKTEEDYIASIRKTVNWSNIKQYNSINRFKQNDASEILALQAKREVPNFNIPEILVVKKNAKKWLEKLTRKAHNMSEYIRNPQLCSDHEEFTELVKQGHYMPGDFFQFAAIKYGKQPQLAIFN